MNLYPNSRLLLVLSRAHSPKRNKQVYNQWHFLFGDRSNIPTAILLILTVGAYSTVFDQ